jgi:hypothetical protein
MLSHEEAQGRRAAANTQQIARSAIYFEPCRTASMKQLVPLACYEDDTLRVHYHAELQRMLLEC